MQRVLTLRPLRRRHMAYQRSAKDVMHRAPRIAHFKTRRGGLDREMGWGRGPSAGPMRNKRGRECVYSRKSVLIGVRGCPRRHAPVPRPSMAPAGRRAARSRSRE